MNSLKNQNIYISTSCIYRFDLSDNLLRNGGFLNMSRTVKNVREDAEGVIEGQLIGTIVLGGQSLIVTGCEGEEWQIDGKVNA